MYNRVPDDHQWDHISYTQGWYICTLLRGYESFLDLTELFEVFPGNYHIDTIRLWNGPGSMITALLVVAVWDMEEPLSDSHS